MSEFGILKIGIWKLFEIWCLSFGRVLEFNYAGDKPPALHIPSRVIRLNSSRMALARVELVLNSFVSVPGTRPKGMRLPDWNSLA
ncbi:MAG: hypothetical protein E3K40_01495 [Candidatus Brocadia sp.]|nr:hypothetical protein [Candidatus Brocadia sp.]